MCRYFTSLPAFCSGLFCLTKMKSEEQEPIKSEQQTKNSKESIVINEEPSVSRASTCSRDSGNAGNSKSNATTANKIDKPKITFQEHDPPQSALANLVAAQTNEQPQCTCNLRSTSVGEIDTQISDQLNNQIAKKNGGLTLSNQASPTIARPSTASSYLQSTTVKTHASRASSSSSNSSTNAQPPKATAATSNFVHLAHCPYYSSELTTHQLNNANPLLLSFPKAISHNDASVFRQMTVEPLLSQTGLEVRRLSDSAALNSSTNKSSTGPNSFMPTRRCVLRLDGCSYLIVANPPETAKSKDATTKSNETIVVRKAQPKPKNISGLRSLGSSSEQDVVGVSGASFETIERISTQRNVITSADSMPPVDTLQACDKAASRLKELIRHIDHGQVSPDIVKKVLHYAICVLDTVSMDETSQKSNTARASQRDAAHLKLPPSTTKQTSDTNNNQATTSLTSRTAKLANIGRAASEVPVSSIITPQNKATIIASPINKSHHHPHIFPSPPCTQITEQNLNATNVFHANRTDANVNRRILDEEDDLSEVQPDAVPTEVREWLATTFTRQNNTQKRRLEDKPKFRSVANAIRAGIMVNRIYRSQIGPSVMQIPSDIIENIKTIDNWSFDCFTLNEKSKNQALKYVTFELMNRYGLLSKFKIPQTYMENFIFQIEQGYLKNKNPYHNNCHAADVTQTVHYMLFQLGLMNWLSDLEIFATLIAAIIHDYQHTGTTNNFHVQSASEIALMYNDRSVLENFHLSTAFQVMRKDDCNITSNLSNEEYKEFRSLVIEMVLATDMNSHFQQIKTIKALLSLPTSNLIEEKPKALSLILHCCDISHPSKDWDLHSQWTALLIEEFFLQGDEERKRGLPYTPLCDRNTTLVPESQIGFIDFIVSPSMDVCGDLLDRIYQSLQSMSVVNESVNQLEQQTDSANKTDRPKTSQMKSKLSTESTFDQSLTSSAHNVKDGHVFRPWTSCMKANKHKWQERAAEDAKLRALMKKNNGADDKNEEEGEE